VRNGAPLPSKRRFCLSRALETPLDFAAALCVSLGEIHKSLEEIHISSREIHKSAKKLGGSLEEIGSSLKKLPISFSELGNSLSPTIQGVSGFDGLGGRAGGG